MNSVVLPVSTLPVPPRSYDLFVNTMVSSAAKSNRLFINTFFDTPPSLMASSSVPAGVAAISANAWGTINQNISSTGEWQEGGTAISPIGIHEIYIPATAMWESTTGGCAAIAKTELATDQDIQTLDFDGAAIEAAQFNVRFPKNWNASTITVSFIWSAAGTQTTDVDWRISGVSIADNEVVTTAYGSAITVTDAHNGTAQDLNISAETAAVTVAGAGKSEFQRFFDYVYPGD